MTSVARSCVSHHLEAIFRAGAAGGLTDRELLDRFVNRELETAEPAIATLVARHGPMVMGVCRRILNDPEDAADAFQATFLVLVRKASQLRVEGSLGRWLHGVSRRIALESRKAASRRAAREARSGAIPAIAGHDPVREELHRILDEEITRLPDKFRSAIVLCDLEGLTHEAAARQLGCPSGTIESRLARGRERLRNRLICRGMAPSALPLAAACSRSSVPPKVTGAVIRMAVKIVSHQSLASEVPASIQALAAWFMQAALLSQLKTLAVALTLIAVGAAGAALGGRARAGEPRNRRAQIGQAAQASPRLAGDIVLPGSTAYDPNTVFKIRPRIAALVEKVYVELGKKVKKGDPLVDLFSTDLAAAKNDFQTAYVQWQHDLTLRRVREELFQEQAISQQFLTDTRNDENKSRLAVTTARQKLVVLDVPEQQIDALVTNLAIPSKQIPGAEPADKARMTRRSPIEGIVIHRDAVAGNLYDHNDVLMTIARLDHLMVWASLSQADRARVQIGQRCAVELPFLTATILSEVVYIAEQPTRDGMVRFRLKVPNAEGRLKADMLVRVRISPGSGR